MPLIKCLNNCCELKIEPYNKKRSKIIKNARKAGVIIYDPKQNKILIVQSRGHLWGPPKGTIQRGETQRKCAVREVFEETGININADSFTRAYNIGNNAIYFYMEMAECTVSVRNDIYDNDANSVGWIKFECLKDCISNGNISLSKHCQILLEKAFQYKFKHPNFTIVKNEKS